jgi:hypothetical protein
MRRILSITLIIFMGLNGVAFGQSAKDAVKALKKLEAKTETGINYKDFATALADTKVEVESFVNSKQAKRNPGLSECLNKTLEHYMLTNKIMNQRIQNLRMARETGDKFAEIDSDVIKTDSPLGKMLMRQYPRIEPHKGKYFIEILIPEIWNEASKELKKCDSLM